MWMNLICWPARIPLHRHSFDFETSICTTDSGGSTGHVLLTLPESDKSRITPLTAHQCENPVGRLYLLHRGNLKDEYCEFYRFNNPEKTLLFHFTKMSNWDQCAQAEYDLKKSHAISFTRAILSISIDKKDHQHHGDHEHHFNKLQHHSLHYSTVKRTTDNVGEYVVPIDTHLENVPFRPDLHPILKHFDCVTYVLPLPDSPSLEKTRLSISSLFYKLEYEQSTTCETSAICETSAVCETSAKCETSVWPALQRIRYQYGNELYNKWLEWIVLSHQYGITAECEPSDPPIVPSHFIYSLKFSCHNTTFLTFCDNLSKQIGPQYELVLHYASKWARRNAQL